MSPQTKRRWRTISCLTFYITIIAASTAYEYFINQHGTWQELSAVIDSLLMELKG